MSHAASMNLLSFDVLRAPGSVDRRLKWALAGSVAVHVAFATIAVIRLMPMIERPVAPYHVDLVTLADIQATPTPAPKSQPASKSQPSPAPPAKPREPERITDSLKGALESVVVPGPRNVEAAKNVEPVSTPPSASQPGPPKPDVPRVQSTPPPPQRASAPSKASPKPSSDTKNGSLAQMLRQAVEKVKVPELRSSQPPSAESPPQKDEAPVQAPKDSRLVKSEKPPSRSDPLSKVKDQEDVPVAVPPQAPTLAKVEHDRTPSRPTAVKPGPSRLRAGDEEGEDAIDALAIPPVEPLQAHRLSSRETASATQETLTDLHVGGAASQTNKYWAQVWSRIDREWVAPPVAIDQREPLQVVLAIRVRRSGRIQEEVLHFVQKSGNEYYDSAAKRAVVAASPLPSFPADMTDPYYDFKFRFTFKHDK